MKDKTGLTLVEVIAVLVILGLAAALTIPNFVNSSEITKAQMARNNIYAISAAEQKYYEDNGIYCVGACAASNAAIAANLHLSFGDAFGYSCLDSGTVPDYFTCTAADATDTLTLSPVIANGSVTGVVVACTLGGTACPS